MTAKTVPTRTMATVLFGSCCLLLLFLAAARAQVAEVPFQTGRITDNAEVLSQEERARIHRILQANEEAGACEIAVLTVASMEGVSLEEFAARVFRTWKLGEKGKGNGVLLLISPWDRRIRIEVGAGSRAQLSEATADRIVRDVMAPHFMTADYYEGIEAGVCGISGFLGGAEQPETASQEGDEAGEDQFFEGPELSGMERFLIGSFIFGCIGLFTIIGVMTPGVGWFLYLFLIPFWAIFPVVVVGTRGAVILLVAYLVLFPVAKLALRRGGWYRRALADLRSKGVAQIGGFTLRNAKGIGSSWSSD